MGIINATAARPLGLEAKTVTIACTSSGLIVVVRVIVEVGMIDVMLFPLEVGYRYLPSQTFTRRKHIQEIGAFLSCNYIITGVCDSYSGNHS